MVLGLAGRHWGSAGRCVGASPSTGHGAAPILQIQGDGWGLGCWVHLLLCGFGLSFLEAPQIRPAQVLSKVPEGREVEPLVVSTARGESQVCTWNAGPLPALVTSPSAEVACVLFLPVPTDGFCGLNALGL